MAATISAVIGLRLPTHHHYVAVRYSGVDYRVTADSVEQCPVADQLLGQLSSIPDRQRPSVPDDLLGQV